MISFKSFALLVLLSCLSVLFTNPSSVSAFSSTVDDIKGACEEAITNYYDLCVESLKSDPRHLKTGPNELGKLSMQISLENATAIQSDMQKLVKNNATKNAVAKETLGFCIKRYNTTINNIRSAVTQFKLPIPPEGSPLNNLLYYAGLNVTSCEEHLRSHGGLAYFVPRSQILSHLISVATDLVIFLEV
ncbi:hypothetical protein FRX31_005605 [Thalictrum thalictroides]|uniref:Pectinesterase inhibitor domain-containing protein n=1 Tax=Thalictrum thalictroides TaxID=46969 RepID=A0A7J6X7D7_THATH|nr:hypothetical protein FRX31_005605 [Thalictrum thalictroides]